MRRASYGANKQPNGQFGHTEASSWGVLDRQDDQHRASVYRLLGAAPQPMEAWMQVIEFPRKPKPQHSI
jgi:hypothetical protein